MHNKYNSSPRSSRYRKKMREKQKSVEATDRIFDVNAKELTIVQDTAEIKIKNSLFYHSQWFVENLLNIARLR